ncbi:MAG: hypothetical protein LW817_06570 [Candidatus Caenarcaniphilales bacterium]|jgi:hypothetical protein|nr:hypothetical protein [Candidatus Caenarcaniphilales bacterium]
MHFLVEEQNFDSYKKILLIFDVDGTLRPDTVEALDHRYPKVDPIVAKKLMELNALSQIEISILTARSYVDIYRSNLPKNVTKYCGFGKQIIQNEILRYPKEEFHRAYDETTMFIDIIKDILGPKLTSSLDFLITPGDFSVYFEAKDFQEQKAKIMEIIEIVLFNSQRWKIDDLGREVVFKDAKYPYTKGDAIYHILDLVDLSEPTKVFFFGDSFADYKAMEALRSYQKMHPQKRLKVKNIAVGPILKDKELVDIVFESYKETLEFVNDLHAKLFSR